LLQPSARQAAEFIPITGYPIKYFSVYHFFLFLPQRQFAPFKPYRGSQFCREFLLQAVLIITDFT